MKQVEEKLPESKELKTPAEKFIDTLNTNRKLAAQQIQKPRLINAIIQTSTFEQFLHILRTDEAIAITLAQNSKRNDLFNDPQNLIDLMRISKPLAFNLMLKSNLRDKIANKITFTQFLEVVKESGSTANMLAMHPSIVKLIDAPLKLIALMEINQQIGKQIISLDPGWLQIISMQKLDQQRPDLFASLPHRKKFLTEQRSHLLTKAKLYTYQAYCEQVLFAFGYVFLKENKQFCNDELLSKTGSIVCTEIGKMILDSLHGKRIRLSPQLSQLMTQLDDLRNMRYSRNSSVFSPQFFEQKQQKNRTDIELSISSVFSITSSNHTKQLIPLTNFIYKICEVLVLAPGEYEARLNSLKTHPYPNETMVVKAVAELNKLNSNWQSGHRPS